MVQRHLKPIEPLETAEQHAARLAGENRLLNEAESEAERIGTIPIEEIRAWVDSWGTANELPMPKPRK
jgi:predicted transcriptional regulator